MGSFNQIISFIILAAGIYSFYEYFKMRSGGKLSENLLLGKTTSENSCKDKEAFRAKALPAVLVLSITTTIYGIIDVINYTVRPMGIADTILMIVFLVVLVWFMYYTGKLKREYF